MIIGIGNDLCDIRRLEQVLDRHGPRFVARCFTETERRRSDAKAGRAASYAKRFAAKEACAKALGTGLSRGVFWRDMGVVNRPSGQPTMQLTGGGGAPARRTHPAGPRGRDPPHLDPTSTRWPRPSSSSRRVPAVSPAPECSLGGPRHARSVVPSEPLGVLECDRYMRATILCFDLMDPRWRWAKTVIVSRPARPVEALPVARLSRG